MRQHSIDLLPSSIRLKAEAGLRAGRLIIAMIAMLGATVGVAMHSTLSLTRAQETLFVTSGEAEQVFIAEAKAAELRRVLGETQKFMALYERLAPSIHISAVMATVINALPESVTLDQFDLDAVVKQAQRTARVKGLDGHVKNPPRILTGEVSGFAANDQQIAEVVKRLEDTPPFKDVSLDFSRTRRVNGKDSREFRLSFNIDLDARYAVTEVEPAVRAAAAPEGGDHAQ